MQTIVAAPELELSNQTGVSLHRIAILTSPSIQQEDVSSKPFFSQKDGLQKKLYWLIFWKYCDRQYLAICVLKVTECKLLHCGLSPPDQVCV